jgi:hypothetical protein
MLESDADRLAMITSLGGQLIRHQGGEFWALFDRDFVLVVEAVETRQPALTARTCDVQHLPKDTVLNISGEEPYRIKRPEPDGTGMTIIILKR